MEKNPIAVEDEPTTTPPETSEEEQERNDDLLELQRTVTGPPYSIFTPRAKIFIVVAVSISSLVSPFGATTFYPALDVIARDLGVTPTLINLSLTTYMVCLTPSPRRKDLTDVLLDRTSHCTSLDSWYV